MVKKENGPNRILLVWNYERIDWIQPFLDLEDQFQFFFLSKFRKKDDQVLTDTKGIQRIYWTDFSSPGALLEKIKPQSIIFMSLIHFTEIVLNCVAKKKNIRTAFFQHGLVFSQDSYRSRIAGLKRQGNSNNGISTPIPKKWRIRYLFGAIIQGLGIKGTYSIMRYLLQKQKYTDVIAMEKNQLTERIPDWFIVYTKKNAQVFKERDGAKNEQMIEIGNPSLDFYFKYSVSKELPFGEYFLLIDTPLYVERSRSSGFGFTKEMATDLYRRILGYAKARQKKLVIKLHPFSFNETPLLMDADVFYVKDEYNSRDLMFQANAILSFPSTLAIPAIYFKPTLLLKFNANSFLDFINSKKLLPVVEIEDLSDQSPEPVWNEKARQFVIEECLYKPDGKALLRLKTTFEDLCKA